MAMWNPSVPQTSQQGLEEIKQLLESKLLALKTQLHILRDTEANNPIDRLPRQDLEQTKKLLLQTLIDQLKPPSPDFNRSGELLLKAVLEKLEMQFKETTRMINNEKHVLNELNEKLNRLQGRCESFANMVSARLESGEMKQAENLDEIEKNLNAEFRKHKRMLKYVIDTIYSEDSDTRRLLSELLLSYFNNPTDYIELSEEEDLYRLERFLQIGLVARHPYCKMKVKLGEAK